jgi:photosystem II stability/assembly factor-like uncharacterized protein
MKRIVIVLITILILFHPLGYAGETSSLVPGFLKTLKPRSIGPANMSGRIVDVAVYEKRPSIMYVASASGGLWKTVNNGITFQPVFERESSVALGAVALAQSNPEIVWVGTGENNARNSVSWGDGVYKSTDGGKTWKNMGLKDSQHIGRIVIHPTNPDIVYVAALGHLWGPNKERGLYKTSDGGKSWKQVKFINDDTGFIDLVMDPSDPEVLYAAAYQVRRDVFSGGNPVVQYGPGSGLYKTSDGGKSWQKMTVGLPKRALGRCGLSVYRPDPKVVYAVVQTDLTPTPVAGQAANLKERIVAEDEAGTKVKRKIIPDDGGIFRSEDGGKTWTYLNSLCPRPFYYGQIRVDPNDDRRIYVLGIQFHVSSDGGKTFKNGIPPGKVHSDHHALWIDPRDSHHLVLGGDGGLYFSYDRIANWEHLLNLPVGQFYAIGVDMRKPYRVYGGLQDNGSWGGPSATLDRAGITVADWFQILGFDGYYCQVDPKDVDTVYCEGQYGILRRVNVRTGEQKDIKPRLETPAKGKKKGLKTNIEPPLPKETPEFRFNWSSPILLSPHNDKTLYYGSNFVFRSRNRGDKWTIISPDLTRGKPGPSQSTGHTITTVAESPLKAGLLYVGTDDGKVHVTQDGGDNWTDLSENLPLPPRRWIARLECSPFDEGTAFLSVDRHRNHDRAPYLFKTTDYGATWKALVNNLPAGGPVHVIKADPRNRNLLYVGTEFGLFLSLNAGAFWHKHPGLPTVPVHDLVVHPRDRELVIATHVRSIYVMDVAPLQDLTPAILQTGAYLFDVKPAVAYRPRSFRSLGGKNYAGQNPPYGTAIYYYLKEPIKNTPTITIINSDGNPVRELKAGKEGGQSARQAGLHRYQWNLLQPKQGGKKGGGGAFQFRPVPAGEYTATLRIGDRILSKKIRVEAEE